ncbi:MAG: hypothetical protein WAS25_00200 [Geothrix sp.]|uniref:hypothetical protein n=1 Tax=Geothrix sp. TaxID=1962974 RepID=UPI003BAFF748
MNDRLSPTTVTLASGDPLPPAARPAADGVKDWLLLGPAEGRDSEYGLYACPVCGAPAPKKHGHVQSHQVSCDACLRVRLEAAAKQRGMTYLGPVAGRSGYHTYIFDGCGHPTEGQPGNLRSGQPRCKACLEEKLREEAHAQGYEYIGEIEGDKRRRWYKHLVVTPDGEPCGHKDKFQPGNMRIGAVTCTVCEGGARAKLKTTKQKSRKARTRRPETIEKYKAIGQAKGWHALEIVGAHGLVLWECNTCVHLQKGTAGNMERAGMRCDVHQNIEEHWRAEADARNLDLVERLDGKTALYQCRVCGHPMPKKAANLRLAEGPAECPVCRERGWREDAEDQRFLYLGPGAEFAYGNYRHPLRPDGSPCGWEGDFVRRNMGAGEVSCPWCGEPGESALHQGVAHWLLSQSEFPGLHVEREAKIFGPGVLQGHPLRLDFLLTYGDLRTNLEIDGLQHFSCKVSYLKGRPAKWRRSVAHDARKETLCRLRGDRVLHVGTWEGLEVAIQLLREVLSGARFTDRRAEDLPFFGSGLPGGCPAPDWYTIRAAVIAETEKAMRAQEAS